MHGPAPLFSQRPLMALTLRLLSIALVSTTFMLAKLAVSTGIHLAEVLFWRQATGVPLLILVLAAGRRLGSLRTQAYAGHAWRSALGLAAMALSFAAPILLPLPVATALGFTAPLFAVALGALFFSQRVSPAAAAASLLGFVGVCIVLQPNRNAFPMLGTICGLGSGLMVALTSYQLRALGRTESPHAVVFWFSAISTPILALALPFVMHDHTGDQWAMLIAIGVLGAAAQILMSAALRFGVVTSVIVMDYSAMIWSILYGWLIWHQLPPPSIWLGAPLIMVAGATVALSDQRLRKTGRVTGGAERPYR